MSATAWADKAARQSADRRNTPHLIRERAQGSLLVQDHSIRTVLCAEGSNTPLWQDAIAKALGRTPNEIGDEG